MLNKINEDIKQSMISGNTVRKDVLKMVKCKAQEIAKENHSEIDNDIVLAAIRKELKQLNQTKDALINLSGSDLYQSTIAKINILNSYLPSEISDDELKDKIIDILKTQSTDCSIGLKMKIVMSQLKGVDGRRVKNIIESL